MKIELEQVRRAHFASNPLCKQNHGSSLNRRRFVKNFYQKQDILSTKPIHFDHYSTPKRCNESSFAIHRPPLIRGSSFSNRYLVILFAIITLASQYATNSMASSGSQRDNNYDYLDLYHTTERSPSQRSLNFWSFFFGPDGMTDTLNEMQSHHGGSLSKDQDNLASSSDKESHYSEDLSPDAKSSFAKRQDPDTLDIHIRNILVPRVSGTQGNVDVRNYIVNSLKSNDYEIELDEFVAPTPIGKVKFSNIIGSSNPKACRQLVLACHYDSKMMDNFLGATDSAVPCAMLLKMSETFGSAFRPNSDDSDGDSLGIKFIFFDGEEAFVHWSDTDSLYGSRHLAEKWEKKVAPGQCQSKVTELKRIELLIVLDLIGSSDTSFVMYNTQLKHHYDALRDFERSHLAGSGLTQAQIRREISFKNSYTPLALIQDDHIPFMKKGVPILSLLASPFPRVWHTIDDNYDAIDFKKTRRLLQVLENFVATYVKRVG